MSIRLLKASVETLFEEDNIRFKEEYDSLSAETDDPINQWLRMAKAKGETTESDKVLLELVLSLHRKVDELTAYIKNEQKEYLPLKYKSQITFIGFEHIKLKDEILTPNQKYYFRAKFPFFPKREVGFYVIAIDKQLANIILMHDRDIKDFNAFITARERAIIRETRGNQL